MKKDVSEQIDRIDTNCAKLFNDQVKQNERIAELENQNKELQERVKKLEERMDGKTRWLWGVMGCLGEIEDDLDWLFYRWG